MASMNHHPLDKTSDHNTPKRAKSNTPPSRLGKTKLALAITPTALFAVTAWFAASTFSGKPGNQANHILQSHLKISFSSTVTVLRVLQGLTSTFTAAAVAQSFEGIQWTLASRDHGLRLLSFLGLSPTTGIFGAIKLVFGRKEQRSDRAWAASRLLFTAVLFVAGLVLFIKTSVITAYNQTDTFHVTAGTGQFNGSFVESFLESIDNVVPYWALASTYNFVTNPLFSAPSRPISCPRRGTQCDSYIFPGGTYLMYPQPSLQPTADSTIIIYDAPGTQIDFALGIDASDQFLSQDCIVYGNDNSLVAVEFCLAMSQASKGSILAGIFACPNGTQAGSCRISQQGPVPNVSTTMTVYNRQATTVCAASNNSILSVYDLGDPQLDLAVNITALHLAVGWLLNYTASGLPAESSINFWFWFTPSGTYSSIWKANAYATLQSLLAFIFWEFCTNNNENPAVAPEQAGGQPALSAAFQTTASISVPYTRFVLSHGAFITYVILQFSALALCWSVIVWQCVSGCHHPKISSYPLIDFASKLQEKRVGEVQRPLSLRPLVSPKSDDRAIRHSLTNVEITVICDNSGEIAEPEASSLGRIDSNHPLRQENPLPADHPKQPSNHSAPQSRRPSAREGEESFLHHQTNFRSRCPQFQASSNSNNAVTLNNNSSGELNHNTSPPIVVPAAPTSTAVSPDTSVTTACNQIVGVSRKEVPLGNVA